MRQINIPCSLIALVSCLGDPELGSILCVRSPQTECELPDKICDQKCLHNNFIELLFYILVGLVLKVLITLKGIWIQFLTLIAIRILIYTF